MRFFHTADLHIGKRPSQPSHQSSQAYAMRLNEWEDAFFDVLDHALHENIDAVLIAGDAFDDRRVSIQTLKRLQSKLKDYPLPTLWITGNHDAYEERFYQELLAECKHAVVLDKDQPVTVIKDTTFVGLPTHQFDLERLKHIKAECTTPYAVALLHGDVVNPKDPHYLAKASEIEACGFNYVALGHIHQHQYVSQTMVYSGSLVALDWSETGAKGYCDVTLSPYQATFIKYALREVRHLTHRVEEAMTDADIETALLTQISAHDRSTHPYRLTLDGEKALGNASIDRLEARLKPHFFALRLKDQRKLSWDLKQLKQTYANTLIDTLLEEDSDDEALALALEALLETEESR